MYNVLYFRNTFTNKMVVDGCLSFTKFAFMLRPLEADREDLEQKRKNVYKTMKIKINCYGWI